MMDRSMSVQLSPINKTQHHWRIGSSFTVLNFIYICFTVHDMDCLPSDSLLPWNIGDGMVTLPVVCRRQIHPEHPQVPF